LIKAPIPGRLAQENSGLDEENSALRRRVQYMEEQLR
jgi:hypothetical protein